MATYLFIYYNSFPIKLNDVFLLQSYDNGLAQGAGLESHGKTSYMCEHAVSSVPLIIIVSSTWRATEVVLNSWYSPVSFFIIFLFLSDSAGLVKVS